MNTRTPGRRRGDGSSPDGAVLEALTGETGDRIIRTVARRRNLPVDVVEDAAQEAAISLITRFGRAGAVAPDDPVGYVYRVVDRAALAVQRGRELTVEDLDQLDGVPVGGSTVEAPADDIDRHDGDPLRRIAEELVAELGGSSEWLLSAVLSYITLAAHSHLVPSDLPGPERGATRSQATAWPALYLAGQVDLVVANAGVAVRQQRSRRIRRLIEFLNQAFAEAAARGEVRGRG